MIILWKRKTKFARKEKKYGRRAFALRLAPWDVNGWRTRFICHAGFPLSRFTHPGTAQHRTALHSLAQPCTALCNARLYIHTSVFSSFPLLYFLLLLLLFVTVMLCVFGGLYIHNKFQRNSRFIPTRVKGVARKKKLGGGAILFWPAGHPAAASDHLPWPRLFILYALFVIIWIPFPFTGTNIYFGCSHRNIASP